MEATTIVELQPEILNQIFYKLPVRSVIYCKLVLQQWRSIISDPVFISTYNDNYSSSSNPLSLIMVPSKPSANLTPSRYEIDTSATTTRHRQPLPCSFGPRDRVAIMGSVNGLVGLYKDPGEFCLFNPSTGAEKTVRVDRLKMNWCADLLFGLCYDPVRQSYKAVLSISSRGKFLFYVVRFDGGDWKVRAQVGMESPSFVGSVEVGSVVKGLPYWASGDSVFFFKQEEEEFRMMSKPDEWGRRKVCGLGGLREKLSVAIKSSDTTSIEVWECGNETPSWSSSWSKSFVIPGEFIRNVSLLWRTNSGEEDEIMVDVNEGNVMMYNVGRQSLRKLVEIKTWRTLYKIVAYVPTLAYPA